MEMERGESYQCHECGLHYKDPEIANKCEAWCKANNSCNLEITKQSIERTLKQKPA